MYVPLSVNVHVTLYLCGAGYADILFVFSMLCIGATFRCLFPRMVIHQGGVVNAPSTGSERRVGTQRNGDT